MKTFITFKNLLTTLAFAFTFAASAQVRDNKMELTGVRSIDATTSELSFTRTFVDNNGQTVRQTIKATDDDGMLTIATLNFALTHRVSEAIFNKAQDESYDAAKKDWDLYKDKGIKLFLTAKPALVNALNKLASYSSIEIKRMKAAKRAAEQRGDFATAQDLANKIHLAEIENAKVLSVHKEISARDHITPKQLSDTLGSLLNEHALNHSYATSIDGAGAITLPLLDNDARNLVANPLGTFFASRPLQMSDDIFRMGEARGTLELAPNVLQEIETASRLSPASSHTRTPSLSDVLE